MVLSNCKKGTYDNPAVPIIGKWKLYATYVGTGGAIEWTIVPKNDNRVVLFNAGGSLGGNMFPEYYNYTIKDSLLTFNPTAAGVQKYVLTIKHDTLTLIPGPPYCIEGCLIRFIKEK
jgi:hypothetical protein